MDIFGSRESIITPVNQRKTNLGSAAVIALSIKGNIDGEIFYLTSLASVFIKISINFINTKPTHEIFSFLRIYGVGVNAISNIF